MIPEVVVACTKRKRLAPAVGLSFHELPTASAARLVQVWHARAAGAETVEAIRLYGGPSWACVLRLKERAPVNIHVMSAGFGLLGEKDLIPPYAATFATSPDQVCLKVLEPSKDRHQEWWREIGCIETPLANILREKKVVIVAAGIQYLHACERDLEQLANALGPKRLLVVNVSKASGSLPCAIRDCLLPVDIRLARHLACPLSTVHHRAAEWLAGSLGPQLDWNLTDLREEVGTLLDKAPRAVRVVNRQTDGQVSSWIGSQLSVDRGISCAKLLRRLRDLGLSCEQSRFRRLFDEVTAS